MYRLTKIDGIGNGQSFGVMVKDGIITKSFSSEWFYPPPDNINEPTVGSVLLVEGGSQWYKTETVTKILKDDDGLSIHHRQVTFETVNGSVYKWEIQ
jgi:hypothetical protein